MTKVLIVGAGNAAMCAGLAALERGASVHMIDAAAPDMAGGNSKYTAGAMRFAYEGPEDLWPLLSNPDDARLKDTEFGAYTQDTFAADLRSFNLGAPLTPEQEDLIALSYPTVRWLAGQGVTFEPIYERQSFLRDGKHVFWGGLTLAAKGEGVGLVEAEMTAFHAKGGTLAFDTPALDLCRDGARVIGVRTPRGVLQADAVVLACGGFEANAAMRAELMGPKWAGAKVRGTPHNQGWGLQAAFAAGAVKHGRYTGCHATPMDAAMKDFGNLAIPHLDRKSYRKICYFLGLMLNAKGARFVDEGQDFRNYTYAQFGAAVLDQPGQIAWQLFDAKVEDLLYGEYRFYDASFTQAETLEALIDGLDGLEDRAAALATIEAFNAAVDETRPFDPTIKDGKSAVGLTPPRSNWAQKLDTPPFKAYPVTGGITFTYGGLKVGPQGQVLRADGTAIAGLFACGELVGNVFLGGYPGGSGLTSGAVFGRRAGYGAAALGAAQNPSHLY